MKNARYLEVDARVRYWEDANVNGVSDTDGTLIPFREGKSWKPIIYLEEGRILDWPIGTTAYIHYKVCDNGDYWLLNEHKQRVAKWNNYYVPDLHLCFEGCGYGDYIIMNVDANGYIQSYKQFDILVDQWDRVGPTIEQHAKNVYELYREAVGGKDFNDDPLPSWDDFSNDPIKRVQQAAWLAIGDYITCQYT